MSLNKAEAYLLKSAHGFVGVVGGNRSPEPMHCAHDGAMIFHPPCYGCHGEHGDQGKKDPSRRYGKNDVDMVDKCIEYFTGANEQANWWKWEQKKLTERWNQSHQYLGITPGNGDLDLQHFVQLFIDAFFSNPGTSLKDRVQVQWSDYNTKAPPSSSSSSYCHTHQTFSTDNATGPHALIHIPKPDPSLPFTAHTAQLLLNTLLHELAHALLLCHGCDCNTCRCTVTRCDTVGLTGHGPVWVKLRVVFVLGFVFSFSAVRSLLPGSVSRESGSAFWVRPHNTILSTMKIC
ncbi:hypothetical protein BDR22DRAFT_424812 [Usnea florida]